MVNGILPLAEEFLMLEIKRVCEKALLTFGKFDLNIVALADFYRLPRLRASAVDCVGRNSCFRSLLNDETFKELEGSSKSWILEKRIRYVFGRLPNDIVKFLSHFHVDKSSLNKIKDPLAKQCDLNPGIVRNQSINQWIPGRTV